MLPTFCRIVTGFIVVAHVFTALASAAPVSFNFTGIVSQVPIDDKATGIQPLDAVFGSFTFDSTAVDAIAASDAGSYTSSGPGFGITVSIGASAITFAEAGALNIGILNSFVDQYTVHGSSPTVILDILLQDNAGTVFSSDALPLSPPGLAGFAQREFHADATDVAGNETQVDGIITTLTCGSGCVESATAPEPSSGALLFAGVLVSCGFHALKERRNRHKC